MSSVRLRNVPVPTWLSQMSNSPTRSDKNATNFPSGEMSGSASVPGKSVKRVNVAFSSGLVQPLSATLRGQRPNANPATTAAARATNVNTRQREGWSRSCVAGASGGAGLLIVSSISMRASPMSRSRRFESFSRHRRSNRSMERGVVAGRVAQSGSRCRISAIVSDTVSPRNTRRPVSISKNTQPKAHMSVRLSTA